MRVPFLALLFCLLSLGSFAQSPPEADLTATNKAEGITVHLTLDRKKIEIGQSVRATLELEFPDGMNFKPVPVGELELKPFELQDGSGARLAGQDHFQKFRYLLKVSAFEEGSLEFPALNFAFVTQAQKELSVTGPTLKVEVVRVGSLPSDKAGQIRDLKAPVQAPFPPLLAALLLVLTIFALWLLGRFVRWLRRPKAVVSKPALPPFDLALQELDRLAQDKPYEAGFFDDYFEKLTLILRTYLSWRFEENLLEKTTSETLDRLKFQTTFGFDSWRKLREVLEEADLVKFAKLKPPAARCQEHLEQARVLVQTYPPKTAALPNQAQEVAS